MCGIAGEICFRSAVDVAGVESGLIPSRSLAGGGVDTSLDPIALHHYLTFQMEAGDWSVAVLDALRTAVERRMVADVPVGVLLSGGLDSSLIVGLLAAAGQSSLATFSVGFEGAGGRAGDEFEFSDLVARHFETDHHRFVVSGDRLLPALERAIGAMSEPMVSHDVVAFHLLSEEVSKHLTVVQSGQGADEVFAGYDWYPPPREAPGDGLDAYAAAFFDRAHAEIEECPTR